MEAVIEAQLALAENNRQPKDTPGFGTTAPILLANSEPIMPSLAGRDPESGP